MCVPRVCMRFACTCVRQRCGDANSDIANARCFGAESMVMRRRQSCGIAICRGPWTMCGRSEVQVPGQFSRPRYKRVCLPDFLIACVDAYAHACAFVVFTVRYQRWEFILLQPNFCSICSMVGYSGTRICVCKADADVPNGPSGWMRQHACSAVGGGRQKCLSSV